MIGAGSCPPPLSSVPAHERPVTVASVVDHAAPVDIATRHALVLHSEVTPSDSRVERMLRSGLSLRLVPPLRLMRRPNDAVSCHCQMRFGTLCWAARRTCSRDAHGPPDPVWLGSWCDCDVVREPGGR